MMKNVTPRFVPFEQKNDNETKNIWTNLFYSKKEPKF